MIKPRLFLCSGAKSARSGLPSKDHETVELDTLSDAPTVNLRLEDVAKAFLHNISPRLIDLLEIASYVYAADCATRRGNDWEEDSIEAWGRDLHFLIPVRDEKFWSDDSIKEPLETLLSFLSDDKYRFTFQSLKKDRPLQSYIELGSHTDWPFCGVDRVLMFSGGLDSLAGTVETAKRGENLVLVSHRPVATIHRRQKALFGELRNTFPNPMIHIPVWVNKALRYGREHTQRTRSFLYSALGAVVAETIKAGGVRFFENGIISMNLPVADEVVRARASRTTHPAMLEKYSRFYALILDRPFTVDNPYLLKTKADVAQTIAENGGAHLIQHTCSCTHAFFQSKTQWHCGTCSQCIDRRVAVLGAGLAKYEESNDYVVDVFVGPRKEGQERNMATDYVAHGLELHRMSETEMVSKFSLEFSRAVQSMEHRSEAVQSLIDVHKRHGAIVHKVLVEQLGRHTAELVEKKLPPTSMLAIVAGQQHLEPMWGRYAARIAGLLALGLPVACQNNKPRDERNLQEICDGILKTHDLRLAREYPFLRWSSSLTKPDWSAGFRDLWVEEKYVRDSGGIRRITEEIAADITKYGDNVKYVLFIVYDPNRAIIDDNEFAQPILARANMTVRIIR